MGKVLWEMSYRHSQEDGVAFDALADAMSEVLKADDPLMATMASSFLYLPMEQIMCFWSARWADQGFPTFQMGHKYASALLSTSVSVEEELIRAPFKAFLIEVPAGLLSSLDPATNTLADIRYVLAHQARNRQNELTWSYVALTTGRVSVWQHGASVARMLEATHIDPGKEWSSYSFGLEVDDRDQRVNFLLQRIILNTCLAVASPENMKAIGKTARMSSGEVRTAPEPLVRTYQVGKPLKLDCRDAVRDYIEGNKPGKKLSVQILVTGHWKRQPHGPKGSLRKTIWREPYWRGPEDAPILTRPHKLGDD